MLHTSYTWNDKYVLPYESEWSICSKFCYLNGLNIREYRQHKNRINRYTTNNDIGKFSHIDFTMSLDTHVHICPECIKHGYHSIFHQSSLFTHCFIHKHIKLQKTNYPYGLTNYYNNRINFYAATPDITVENIVKNQILLSKINNIYKSIKFNNAEKYYLLNFSDERYPLLYDEEIRKFLLHKIFGYKNYSSIIEIFRIKKEDIFKASLDILKAIKFDVYNDMDIGIKSEENCLYTYHDNDTTSFLFEYILTDFKKRII